MDRRTFLASAAVVAADPAAAAMPFPIGTWEMHRRPRDYLATPGLTAAVPANVDGLVARLLKSYRTSFKESHYAGGQWTDHFQKWHGSAHKTFMHGSVKEAVALLGNPSGGYLHYGFDETQLNRVRAMSKDSGREYAITCKMQLVTIGEAAGVIRLENPEQYDRTPITKGPHTEVLMRALDKALGITIDFPNPFPNEYGLQTNRGVAGFRAAQSIYQAYRIKKLVAGIKNPRILEIGAGTGRTAYYCNRLGITNYSIVDLPFTAISCGYFLGRVLGPDSLTLDGEHENGSIRLLSPDSFATDKAHYDLIVNVDSFTEMPLSISRGYVKTCQQRAPRMWSINHEANEYTMQEIAQTEPTMRYPCWIRHGYTEELYDLRSPPAARLRTRK